LLPDLVKDSSGGTFEATPSKSLKLGKATLYSHKTCISPVAPPTTQSTETIALKTFNIDLLKKYVDVHPEKKPALKQSRFEGPVAIMQPLIFQLDRTDRVFVYQLEVNRQSLYCPSHETSVYCDLTRLNLSQSTEYVFSLKRLFNGSPAETVFEQKLRTVEAVQVTGSTIGAGHLIFDAPNEMSISLNKPAESLKDAKLFAVQGESRQELPVTPTIKDNAVIFRFDQPLPRSATLVLSVGQIIAADGSRLMAPYVLEFKTSGGPKVTGINIGSYRVSQSAGINLSFDSAVSAAQDVGPFVRLEINGSAVPASVSVQGASISIRPHASLPRCTGFTVKVLDGLQNSFGIAGGSAWSYNSRTICQSVFSIGTSVRGRGITAYGFGSGASKIVFVGTTHGNETSSTRLLNSWIDYLEANAHRIPANRTVIVIPNLNPDGYAAGSRTNARNVDLNRNFPAFNWKQGVTMPDKTFNSNGGGPYPLSEPESASLASYVLGQNPRLVLTYHATGGVVVPNDSGDSLGLAKSYANQSSVYFLPNGSTASFFEYDTTGAFEDWLHDKHGIPTLLVELNTQTGNEFSGHSGAMWSMVSLP
jgi:protein MpaA